MSFFTTLAARILAKRGHDKQHQRILSTARQMRRELGLAQHPALET